MGMVVSIGWLEPMGTHHQSIDAPKGPPQGGGLDVRPLLDNLHMAAGGGGVAWRQVQPNDASSAD